MKWVNQGFFGEKVFNFLPVFQLALPDLWAMAEDEDHWEERSKSSLGEEAETAWFSPAILAAALQVLPEWRSWVCVELGTGDGLLIWDVCDRWRGKASTMPSECGPKALWSNNSGVCERGL